MDLLSFRGMELRRYLFFGVGAVSVFIQKDFRALICGVAGIASAPFAQALRWRSPPQRLPGIKICDETTEFDPDESSIRGRIS